MAVSEGTARVRYIGTGSTGPFAFNFKLYDEDHLLVTHTDTDGVDTTLTKTTDYTVTVEDDYSSAEVTLVVALAGDGVDDGDSEILTLTRDPPVSQLIEWPRNDPFPAATHERAADLLVMLIDRLNEKIGRSLLLPESSTLSDLQIPAADAGKALGWNTTEDDLENVSIPDIYVQDSAPTGALIAGSLWIDSDSTDIDVYQYVSGAWSDTTLNLKGATGATGATGEVTSAGTSTVDNLASFTDGTGDEIQDSGLAVASVANVRAAVADKLVTAELIETSSAIVTLTDAATIAFDWDTGINFDVTLGGNRTLGNPTNGQPGTWRTIEVIQDGTGGRTLAFGGNYVFKDGTAPTVSAGISAHDRLFIFCATASRFEVYGGELDLS